MERTDGRHHGRTDPLIEVLFSTYEEYKAESDKARSVIKSKENILVAFFCGIRSYRIHSRYLLRLS